MSRCTCFPPCPRCGNGPCDCTCTMKEVNDYIKESGKLRKREERIRVEMEAWKQEKIEQLKSGTEEFSISRKRLVQLLGVEYMLTPGVSKIGDG